MLLKNNIEDTKVATIKLPKRLEVLALRAVNMFDFCHTKPEVNGWNYTLPCKVHVLDDHLVFNVIWARYNKK